MRKGSKIHCGPGWQYQIVSRVIAETYTCVLIGSHSSQFSKKELSWGPVVFILFIIKLGVRRLNYSM